MKLYQLLTIKSTICLTVGILFILIPGVLLTLFGVPNNGSSGLFFMTRLYGAVLLLLGLLAWLGRNLCEEDIRRVLAPPIVLGDAASLMVAFAGLVSGMMNDLGWFVVAFYLFLTLGFGACVFPRSASQFQAS
jgi:hypothetical protein